MDVGYDVKGKYFTKVVNKIVLQATIQTTTQRIRGELHIHPGHRLLDELNSDAAFLAVTNARVMESEDVTQAEFLALSKEQIVWVVPMEKSAGGNDDNR